MKVNEPTMSNHAKRVLKWRESFFQLEENQFFEIMRMYLGEIKTPYNKQKLITSLETFLHKKENLVAIKSFLSKEEIEIVCAVVFIQNATEKKLFQFFEKTFTYSFLYETLLNLEERLILYRAKSENSLEEFDIELNPFLEDIFFDLIEFNKLIPNLKFEKQKSNSIFITPELIACFVSYVVDNPCLSKQDGNLKKHALEEIENIFGDSKQMIPVLYKSFLNLSILKQKESSVEIDWEKLNCFIKQSFIEQVMYIVVSSYGHFSRASLKYQAQIFVNIILNLREKSFTNDIFLRTGFLSQAQALKDCNESQEHKNQLSRFSKILQEGRSRLNQSIIQESDKQNVEPYVFLESMFDVAVNLGIFEKCGITLDKQDVFLLQQNFFLSDDKEKNSNVKKLSSMINIEAAFDVNVMPGFDSKDIIPIIKFMSLKRYDTVCNFIIDKSSIMRGFDFGLTVKDIVSILQERMNYEIPQVLLMQLEDWSSSYSSAAIYKGFVLKVDGKAAIMAQNSPVFSSHIHTVIAPGIFLLDVIEEQQVLNLIKESGLDFIGKIKTASTKNVSLEFSKLNLTGKTINTKLDFETPKEIVQAKNPKTIVSELNSVLKQMQLEEEQKESLELRIQHKVIINSTQLNAGILRLERVNANAMDFSGKIYVIEQAIKNKELIELKFSKDQVCVIGKPICVKKNFQEAFVEILLVPENVVKEFALGKASFVKRIRTKLY